MVGLLVKLLITPVGIIVASWIFPNVNFANWFQPIILGIVAAVIGYFMERLMLREDTNWMTTIADFVVSSAIIYFGAMFFVDANVTFWGSILTGALLAVTEIFQHNWLIRNERAGMDDPVRE
ncbi:MAG TPA: DUF2512 family protein [Bacillota bacterium]|nr:DUF2512 family protein [Bacillota bacterium]